MESRPNSPVACLAFSARSDLDSGADLASTDRRSCAALYTRPSATVEPHDQGLRGWLRHATGPRLLTDAPFGACGPVNHPVRSTPQTTRQTTNWKKAYVGTKTNQFAHSKMSPNGRLFNSPGAVLFSRAPSWLRILLIGKNSCHK